MSTGLPLRTTVSWPGAVKTDHLLQQCPRNMYHMEKLSSQAQEQTYISSLEFDLFTSVEIQCGARRPPNVASFALFCRLGHA